jgi:pyruvate kinase
MRNIIESVEDSDLIHSPVNTVECMDERFITKSICRQASHLADSIEATAITTLTHSGYTAFQISSWRPKSNILVFSDNPRILAMLNLLWGVKAHFYNKLVTTENTVQDINKITLEKEYAVKGDFVINLTSMPVKAKGKVNTMRISQL